VTTTTTPRTVDRFSLRVLGEPRGQGRPRFARVGQGVRTYTDDATRAAIVAVQHEWAEAGRPRIEGPVGLEVMAFTVRPKGHYRTDGSLSAAGKRHPYPDRKPDATNIAKLVEDALTECGAWRDDSDVVQLRVVKLWAELAHVQVVVWGVA
jgi:Holliday junction resolvase RusA-like endonuclease